MKRNTSSEIMEILLKDFTVKQTITSLAKEIGISRVGVWKALKNLEKEKLVTLLPIGSGKTSTYSISLDWSNPLTEKNLSLILSKDAIKNKRWLSNFAELEGKVDFLIIYGSIIYSSKEANDIDILGVLSNKKYFKEVEEIIQKIQRTQIKKIHALNFIPIEIKQEIERENKAFIDAIKKGIVLFGQEKFIKFIKNITRK